MNACKQSLSVLSCVDAGQTEQNGTLIVTKRTLASSTSVICREREYISNVTCSEYDNGECIGDLIPWIRPPTAPEDMTPPGFYQRLAWPTQGPPLQLFDGWFGATRSLKYFDLLALGWFFTVLYGLGIPVTFFVILYRGRNRLNQTDFGKKFGYLYKRYDAEWYWWETVVMLRKALLASVAVFLRNADACGSAGTRAVVPAVALATTVSAFSRRRLLLGVSCSWNTCLLTSRYFPALLARSTQACSLL